MVSQHAAALTVLSLAATGAVLAARPAPPASGPQASRARHVAPVEHEPRRATLTTPGASRLKIKFQDDYRARLLPNGSLLSLTGRDVSSVNRSIEAFGLELTPAVTMSDAKLDDLRLAIEHRSDTVMPDIAATFWADGTPRAVAAAAKHFVSDSAIDYASVVKVQQLPEAVLDAKERPRPTTTSKPTVDPTPDPDYWSTDTPHFLEREQWFIDHAERMEQGPLPIPKKIEIASADIQMERFLDSMDRAHDQARRRNREFMENRNLRGSNLIICCIFQLVDPDGVFPSGDEVWRKSCLGDEGLTTADICDSLNNEDTSVSVVQGVYGVDTCGAVCLDYAPMAYGACCIPNVRDGEDSFVAECVDGGGVFEGTIPGSTLEFNSYWSCDVCGEVLGSCCLNGVAETPTGGWVWNGEIEIWPKQYCLSSGADPFYDQPDVASGRLRSEVIYWNNLGAQGPQLDANPEQPLWEWQNFDTPPATFNPPVIVNARVISNDDQTAACDRCLEAGGYYVRAMLPNIRYGGDVFCGLSLNPPADSGVIDCETDERDLTQPLGGCSTSGVYTITTETLCNEGCTGGNFNDLHGLSCWQQNMILPDMIGPEGHSVHGGNWRPLWVQWFTPPPVLEEPDPATWLVPYWEYAGTYSDWTGWDPERWWDEGFQPNLAAAGQPATNSDQFLLLMGSRPADNANATWYPALSTFSQFIPAPPTEDEDSVFVPNYMVPNYGPCIRHGFGPTGLEYYAEYGIPQQVGDPLSWGDWPVLPETDAYTFEFQCIGSAGASSPPPDQMFPWDHARNRWTDDSKFFRIGTPPSNDDTGFGRINNRYLNLTTPGVTIWNYYGDGLAPHPGDLVPPHDWTYGYPYELGEPSDPLRGSCYFPRSHNSPTVPLTNTLPGIQAVYTGAGCNEPGCCTAIEAVVPGCCPETIGTGDLTTWDPLCVQVALDLVLLGQGAGAFFDSRTCTGITPYLVPEYANEILGNDDLRPGEYNPDPRNSQLNPYLNATLPAYVNPALADADTCTVADTSAANRFHPLGRTNDLTDPITPPDPPAVGDAPTQAYLDYADVRDRSARLYQFMPRCAGIYSASGQCNVAGNYSGRSSWAAIADDETTLIGCKDYDCCMRVISTILDDKDDAANGDLYTDLEWVNWGHLGYPPEIADYPELLPPMAGQWTAAMASRARSLCYPDVVQQDDPDFFNLQFHMNRQALAQSPAGYGACCIGANCDFVGAEECASLGGTWNGVGTTCSTNPCNGGTIEVLNSWIVGPNQTSVQDDPMLRDLVWAPFSWSDNSQWDYAAASTCRPPHQNIFGLLPDPYYAGDGLAIYPWDIDPIGNNADPYESVATASQFFADEAGTTMGAFGLDVNIAVLGETAWLQERVIDGVTVGAVHSDLGQVVLEGPAMSLPTVDMPFTGPIAQSQAARCTAVLGVIAATDNAFGVTGMAHEATTMFFPTESTSGTRIEDAFLHALSQLNAGDVMLLAWQASSANGFVLDDPGVMTLVDLARASGISVVVPAGDMQQPVGITTEDAGIIVVGGAAPASRDGYLRWWSSNYSTAETPVFTPGTVNICAWGGGVTTTGGNANLSMVAIADTYTEDLASKEASLTLKGRQQSYTNDFGSRLDGSLAAASQITGAAACAQGVCRQLYNGDSMLAADLHLRLYTTSTYFNGSDSGGLGPGFPTGYGGNGSPNAIYTWDIDEALDTPASVGRFPQLGKLMRDLYTSTPDDFVEGDWARISRLDIVTGTLEEGDRFSLVVDADEDVAWVNSAFAGMGAVSTDFDVPGLIHYSASGEIVDIMVTVQTSGRVNLTGPFGIVDTRFGPWTYAVYVCYVFNFQTGRWEGFDGPIVTNPGDGAPTNDVFGPYVPFATVSQYIDPQTDKLFIRFISISGGSDDPYNMGFDYVWFLNPPAPEG